MFVFICGSALRGEPDHGVLAGARFVTETRTVPKYRMHTVADRHPGVYETNDDGVAIAGELYELSQMQWETLLLHEPPGLYPAFVELENGCRALAMLFPRECLSSEHKDISAYGGWKAYKKSLEEKRV